MTSLDDNKVIIIVVINIRNQLKNGVLYPEVLEHINRTRKQHDFWATPVNRKWDFCILGRQVCPMFWANSLYKSKETWLHKSILKGQRPHFPLTYVTQKRICWSSLLHWKHRTSSLFHVVWYLLLSVVFLTIKFTFLSIFTDQHWADVWQGYLHTVLPVVLNLQ